MAKDVTNITFFIIVAWVTILTYLRAKRTILQPIRTEVFKQQLELFARIQAFFVGKTELELRDDFGVSSTLKANCWLVADLYRQAVFGAKQDESQRPYSRTECPTIMLRIDTSRDQISNDDGQIKIVGPPVTTWDVYELHGLRLHRQFSEREKAIIHILESPLLPNHLRAMLEQFRDTLRQSLNEIRMVLEQQARKFPLRFPVAESMIGVDITLLPWNEFNQRASKLKPIGDEILEFIRDYFGVEKLLED